MRKEEVSLKAAKPRNEVLVFDEQLEEGTVCVCIVFLD